MPDKHLGRTRHYESIYISVYRKPIGTQPQCYALQGIVGPYYIKDRKEIPKLFWMLAQTNKTQGFYDWGFTWESRGQVRHQTVEDSDWQMKQMKKEGFFVP